jgi:hypothetical protein
MDVISEAYRLSRKHEVCPTCKAQPSDPCMEYDRERQEEVPVTWEHMSRVSLYLSKREQ